MHRGGTIVAGLQRRFRQTVLEYGPYYFPDLDGVTESDERAAIDTGVVQPARIHFVGRRPDPQPDRDAGQDGTNAS
jgi:hypothetical protein